MHSHIIRNVLQHKINTQKTKARFSRLLRHPAYKLSGSILKGEDEEERKGGEAYDLNKQTIYLVLKSKIRSMAHYAPESACETHHRNVKSSAIFQSKTSTTVQHTTTTVKPLLSG